MSIITNKNLPHTATIYRRKRVSGGKFSTTQTLVSDTTGVKCWVQLAKFGEKQIAAAKKKDVSHKVYFSSNPGLKEGDALRVTASKTESQEVVGLELEFQLEVDASAGLGIIHKLMFIEFQLPHTDAEQ